MLLLFLLLRVPVLLQRHLLQPAQLIRCGECRLLQQQQVRMQLPHALQQLLRRARASSQLLRRQWLCAAAAAAACIERDDSAGRVQGRAAAVQVQAAGLRGAGDAGNAAGQPWSASMQTAGMAEHADMRVHAGAHGDARMPPQVLLPAAAPSLRAAAHGVHAAAHGQGCPASLARIQSTGRPLADELIGPELLPGAAGARARAAARSPARGRAIFGCKHLQQAIHEQGRIVGGLDGLGKPTDCFRQLCRAANARQRP